MEDWSCDWGVRAADEQLRQVIKKCVPQPSNPLKSFNWSKLPECKVDGTIWTDIDDSRLYKQLDLQEVDRLFSAYQKNGIMVSCSCIKYDWSINTCHLSPSLSHSISVLNHDPLAFWILIREEFDKSLFHSTRNRAIKTGTEFWSRCQHRIKMHLWLLTFKMNLPSERPTQFYDFKDLYGNLNASSCAT